MLAREASIKLENENISCDVIDVRILNPFDAEIIVASVKKTKHLLVVDSGCLSAGFSAEIVSKVVERLPVHSLNKPPVRLALPDAPAPTSKVLEEDYFLNIKKIIQFVSQSYKI